MNFEDNRNNRNYNDNCADDNEIAIANSTDSDISLTDDSDNCPNCGSDETESVDGYEYCICGLEIGPSDYDHGFVPTNPNPVLGAPAELGSTMGPTRDRVLRRLDRLHRRETRVKPNFVDGVKEQLTNSPIGVALYRATADIIDTADSKEKLGMMRHSLRGARQMSKGDTKQYRKRLFAAASMEILQDAGYETPVVVVKGQWCLDKYDLKKVKAILKRLVKGEIECLSNAATPPAIARRLAIMHQLTTYRDHLIDQEGRVTARTVFEDAIEIARSFGEPVLDGDDWNDPCDPDPLTNRPASVVAGRAIMEAMGLLGMSRQSRMELHSRYPVYNLDTFMGKKASRARDDVEEEA